MNQRAIAVAIGTLGVLASGAVAQAPTATYWAYVGAESADLIHRIKFGPNGAELERTIPAGESPVETEGPHGLRISPDGRYLYMTTGHGLPDGKLWKYELGPDTLVSDPILLGYFPATLDLTPDGLYAFIVNFNLHGEKVPSTMSVVYTPSMMEVAQVETCTMPHGSRINAAGDKAYSACMMDDQLVEVDTRTFAVTRRFSVAKGAEHPIAAHDEAEMAHDGAGPMASPSCSPTWGAPSPDGASVFVACNAGDEILEVDVASWTLKRKIPTGRGPYNLAFTPDGRMLVSTLKQGGAVQFFAMPSGNSLKVIPSTTTVTHGVDVSSDSRYAFVSVEGVGAEPGKVDIYDLQSLERVGSVEVGQQAGGIAFWKMAR